MWVIKYRKLYYSISGALIIASIAALFVWGLLPGIDFTGGTLVHISYEGERPSIEKIVDELKSIDPAASVRTGTSPTGEPEYIVRMRAVDITEKDVVMNALSLDGTASSTLKSFDSIGPVLGAEALRKAYWSIGLVILAIVLFITLAFRKVSEPIPSWKYGLIAIVALVHDVIIPTGVFAFLGEYHGYEVNTLFVTALLVVLGFSVHNTIVVFDRVREKLRNGVGRDSFDVVVGKSVGETLTRSMNTTLTTLIALFVLFFVAGSMTQSFVLALIVGIVAGTWSSLVIAPPLLVTLEKLQKKK
jgi:preprotein translocase subunit SecF